MLIPSARHTAKDLALWREHEAADLIHGATLAMRRKAQKSLDAIREFVDAGDCYCSISWGKDSVVLAHLWWQVVGERLLAFWHRRPGAMPETEDVEHQFLARFRLLYTAIEDPGRSAIPIYERIAGTERYLTGVRADESSVRRMSARCHGVATDKSCRPLLNWTTQDVFGYLAVNQLPVHPAYAMVGGGRWERDRLRVEVLGGEEGDQFGRREWEQEYYGDVIRRLA